MELRILFAMLPHDDKTLTVRSDAREAGKPLEASTKDATLHEMLARQEMLSHFLHVSPKEFSQRIPHVNREVFGSCRHGVYVLDHPQDGGIRGFVNELQAMCCIQDFIEVP